MAVLHTYKEVDEIVKAKEKTLFEFTTPKGTYFVCIEYVERKGRLGYDYSIYNAGNYMEEPSKIIGRKVDVLEKVKHIMRKLGFKDTSGVDLEPPFLELEEINETDMALPVSRKLSIEIKELKSVAEISQVIKKGIPFCIQVPGEEGTIRITVETDGRGGVSYNALYFKSILKSPRAIIEKITLAEKKVASITPDYTSVQNLVEEALTDYGFVDEVQVQKELGLTPLKRVSVPYTPEPKLIRVNHIVTHALDLIENKIPLSFITRNGEKVECSIEKKEGIPYIAIEGKIRKFKDENDLFYTPPRPNFNMTLKAELIALAKHYNIPYIL